MEIVHTPRQRIAPRSLYLANLFLSFHIFLIVYINSSFISTFINEKYIGAIYVIGSLIGIGAFFLIVKALRTIGNYKTLLILAFLVMGLILSLAIFEKALIILSIFVIYLATFPLIQYGLDIFLESASKKESTTGNVRGIFLTMQNTALILSPFIAGFVIGGDNFWKVYILSAAFMIPFLYIALRHFKNFADPSYDSFQIKKTFNEVLRNRNIYSIFMSQFILRLFFAWMVIYTPLYLHNHIGFSWPTIGVILTITLLPFLLVELPAGKFADTRLGEKEMLSLGFIIMGLATISMSIFTEANVVFWIVILLLTRLGAGLVEIMSESYFFKHVAGDDADIISLFRMARPFAYITAALIATLALLLTDFRFIFIIFGLILLWGLRYSLSIEDTR